MLWKRPQIKEINCGMEVNMYYPGERDEDDYLLNSADTDHNK